MAGASDLLSQTIDAYMDWLVLWHRLAFFDHSAGGDVHDVLMPPPIFHQWQEAMRQSLPQDKASIEKLAALHDQLHILARLVLMKMPERHTTPTRKDYDNVVAKYEELIQGLRRLERALAFAASGLDPLTGLRSRTGLTEDLAREQNRFLRSGRPFCLALMDIDHFKSVNDTYGHEAGDRVLAAVADRISRDLRSFDDAWRWGGEEFLFCLKEADDTSAVAVLERLRMALASKPVILADGKSIPVTASFGFAMSRLNVTPEELIRAADQALYRAKAEGRNRIVAAATIKD